MPVTFAVGEGERAEAVCHDLCLGGAFLATTHLAAFGSELLIYLELPGIDGEVAVRATVRWVKAEGMGVQFASLGIHETRAIMSLVKPAP